MIRNRAQNAATWDMDKLIAILIRQFKRPLSERGLTFTESEIIAMAQAAAQREPVTEPMRRLCDAMADAVRESLGVLAAWDLTYPQALATSMDAMPGWETTADFLEMANEKGNAELRISAGASLMAALGDLRFADMLIACYENGVQDPEDVDAVIAKRALSFALKLDEHAPEWLTRARQALESLTVD